MTTSEEILEELKQRILADIKHLTVNCLKDMQLLGGGYIASLYEWSFITQESFAELASLLPQISDPNPVAEIFTGRDDDEE